MTGPEKFAHIPDYTSLKDAVSSIFGPSVSVVKTQRAWGGDINVSAALTLSNGTRIFMKSNKNQNPDFFASEAAGLSAIQATGTLRTPKILCTGKDSSLDGGCSFLLLEYVESAPRTKDYWERFAQELSAMHSASVNDFVPQDEPFGFFMDNYIGRTVQQNRTCSRWTEFFRDMRLYPQFNRAASYFDTEDRKAFTRLLDHLDKFLPEPQKPSLIHGDLWSGNVMCSDTGSAMLIDPACYVGHAEADIAMTSLFGGFPAGFYAAYAQSGLLQPGYSERQDLYNLYHILNHLNMFGASYLAEAKSIISEYAR